MNACPTSEVIDRVANDPDSASPEFLEHLAGCQRCRDCLEHSEVPVKWEWLGNPKPTPGEEPNVWYLDRLKVAVRLTATSPADRESVVDLPGFAIEEEIARGGMGVVYRARDLTLGRTVAIKWLRPDLAADPARMGRFHREAKALAALQHPNVVQLFQAGEVAGRPYLVMEYMPGGTLRHTMRTVAWQPTDAAKLGRTLADAVEAVHRIGVIHRDLKPSNVLLTDGADPVAKVADFGIARFLDSDDRQTQTGEILGTPEFMAPEQVNGQADHIGPETDVWALGTILYELIAGRQPFSGVTKDDTFVQIREIDPVPLSRLRAGLSADLAAIVHKCLEKDPKLRYRTAAALRDDLDNVLADRPVSIRSRSRIGRVFDLARMRPARTTAWIIAGILLVSLPLFTLIRWRENEGRIAIARGETEQLRDLQKTAANELYATRIASAAQALEDHRPEVSQSLLEKCLPKSGETDLRGWEWHYLSNRLRGAAQLDLQPSEVESRGFVFPAPPAHPEAISPDHRRKFTVDATGRIAVHDDVGRLLLHLPNVGRVLGLNFSDNGRWLAARTADDRVIVFEGGE